MIIFILLKYLIYIQLTLGVIYYINNFINKTLDSEKRFRNVRKEDQLNSSTEFNKTRYSKRRIPKDLDTIVIGSGIGGLTTGALLAKSGKKVLVLEQHYIAGGTTHSFIEHGVEHETGLHYIGNIEKRKPILDLITDNNIEWCKLGWERDDNRYVYDEIFIGDEKYEFESGEENLKRYLQSRFPNEKPENFDLYFEFIKKASSKSSFFIAKLIPYRFIGKLLLYFDNDYQVVCTNSAYSIISKIFEDKKLISVLLGQFGDYGPTPKKASFFIHASIVNHYLEGGWFPKGGTGVISNEICKTIKQYGGEVLVGKGVEHICIDKNGAYGVKMKDGEIIYANNIISATGLRNTFDKLVDSQYTPKIYTDMLSKMPPSVQHMYCFVKLKGTPSELNLRSSNMWIYPHGDFDTLIEDFLKDPLEAPMPLFMGFSCRKDEDWEKNFPEYSNAIILTQVDKNMFNEWENEKCMKRGIDYTLLKEAIGERMLEEGLFKYYPELRDKVECTTIGTPLSTQFYLDVANGESYGLDMNEYRLLEAIELRPKTNIKNLYLSGQDICTLGITGAMMGGVLAANVVAGYDNMIDICLKNNIVSDLQKIEGKKYN